MFNRNIEEQFKEWLKSPIRKPLIVRGARQVGKTSVIRKFSSENFKQVIEINLEKKDQLEIFDRAIGVEDFLKRIAVFFDKSTVPGNTLLFIDEIQESKNIMKLLRFFAEEKPELHVMAAGSLLEAKMDKNWTIPVGRIDYKYIYPMTFFEYLEAKKKTALLESLKNIKPGDEFDFEHLAIDLYKDYVLIGGMPEVVKSYINSGSYDQVKTILNRLHTAYIDDIRKYARSNSENKYLEQIIELGPRIAGSLFKYENFADSSFRSREMSQAINTIEKVMLLKQIMAVSSTRLPFIPKTKRPKKMIWLDIGLVNFVNNAYKEMIKGEYKGRIMEQIVGQGLLAGGIHKQRDLYYWAKNRTEGSAEVDFCLQHNSRTVGIEVKSGNISKMRSLFSMSNSNKDVILVRVSWEKLRLESYEYADQKYNVFSIPFYLVDRLCELVDQFFS